MRTRVLYDDAKALFDAVNMAGKAGDLSDKERQYLLSLLGNVTNTLKHLNQPSGSPYAIGASWQDGPLSEYTDFPTSKFSCPKCGDTKAGRRFYSPTGRDGPEHVRHACYCGYAIRTKPVDATPDPYAYDDEDVIRVPGAA